MAAIVLGTAAKALPAFLAPVYLAEVVRVLGGGAEPGAHVGAAGLRWFITLSVAFALLLLANPPFTLLTVRLISDRARTMERRLRSAVVQRLQHLSIAFHHERPHGALQAKVLADVQSVVSLVHVLMHRGIETVLGLAVALTIVALHDWRVLVFFLLTAPMAVLILRTFGGAMRRRNRDHRRRVEGMSARVGEMINLIPVTRAHGVEHHEIGVVEGHLADVHHAARRVDLINGWFSACSWVALHLFGLALVVGSGLLVYHGHMTVDKLVLYHGLYWLTIANLEQMLNLTPVMTQGLEAIDSLGEVLACPDLEHNEGGRRLETVRGDVTFDAVTFRYAPGDEPAVKEFSLTVQAGECVALVGESGSGKSTLINLLIGFWRPQAGAILLDGHPQATLDLRAWRQHLAVVPQHTVLFSGTLRDNIAYGLDGVGEAEVERAVDAANLAAVVAALPRGLDTVIGENGATLSGGQRQRVAIARAIVRNPKVIVLDEATSALDVASEREVQRALGNLIGGRTTFIIAHRLSTVRHADRVVVMRRGRCVEVGPREALLATAGGEFATMEALQRAEHPA